MRCLQRQHARPANAIARMVLAKFGNSSSDPVREFTREMPSMSTHDRRQDEGRKFNRQLCAEAASFVAELVTNAPYRRAIR